MKDQLFELLPEISFITDSHLRQQTVAVFSEAMVLGGWAINDLDRIPFTMQIPNNPINLVRHIRSVCQISMATADVLENTYPHFFRIDRDVLRCGALLHDVGKLIEYMETESGFVTSPTGKFLRHPFIGASLASKHGLPPEVAHIIATHGVEGNTGYRTPSAMIVHYATAIAMEPLKELLS